MWHAALRLTHMPLQSQSQTEVLRTGEEKSLFVSAASHGQRDEIQLAIEVEGVEEWSRVKPVPIAPDEQWFCVHPSTGPAVHIRVSVPQQGLLIFKDASTAPYRVSNESNVELSHTASCG